jgi:simple sugar transport system ATP-binding protein
VLSAHRVVQRFGSTLALAGVDFAVSAGEIVGLAGANGAGKSTLIGILSGALRPTEGDVLLDGSPVVFSDPEGAAAAGIATVHQDVDLALVPTLTVAENLVLDAIAAGTLGRFPGPRRIRAAATEVLGGLSIDLDTPVSLLRTSEKQQLLIARALHRGARVLILDEPTAALSVGEQRDLHARLVELAAAGTAIVYITHHLGELAAICTRVVALREGSIAGEFPRPLDHDAVVRAMLGPLAAHPALASTALKTTTRATRAPLFSARGVRARPEWPTLDLDVHPGEVLGITGLLGSGKTELLRQFAGADPLLEGTLEWDGGSYAPRHPADAIRSGIGFVAEDRRQGSEFPDWDVASNITVADLTSVRRGGLLSPSAEYAAAARAISDLRIVASGPRARLRSLSGGNRQKVVVARWLTAGSRLLLLDEPFRGVDLGARADLAALLRTGRVEAAIVASSDPEEILEVADRILVLAAGRIVGEVRPREQPIDADDLAALILAIPEPAL